MSGAGVGVSVVGTGDGGEVAGVVVSGAAEVEIGGAEVAMGGSVVGKGAEVSPELLLLLRRPRPTPSPTARPTMSRPPMMTAPFEG